MSAPTIDQLSATTLTDYIPLLTAGAVSVVGIVLLLVAHLPDRRRSQSGGGDTAGYSFVVGAIGVIIVGTILSVGASFSPGTGVTDTQSAVLREYTANLGISLSDQQADDVIRGLREETSPTLRLVTGDEVRDTVFTAKDGRVVVAATTSRKILRSPE